MINGGVTVNMGQANTEWKSIPTLLEVNDTLNFNYNFDFKDLEGVKYTSVINVGNPHIIFWFDNIENIFLGKIYLPITALFDGALATDGFSTTSLIK